ncbi:GNAT family N-acetyltransferase [Paractinoplanes atraurantiacus]|uniref:Acetyltransferase (GNAT) domain-containing protein n=1 Tax=Paractinoplanes atraurantiacus TaxID=1036182 RepID=A0A285IH07_9ACTN|nr:GNAT family N-acetyltransferase [Actinoplanes atraurantiacus]SNY47242.1 Acetyltransferase (GNAT) domain-containing protein [Actinoplanes atraurantiacus]
MTTRLPEAEIGPELHLSLQGLLRDCFPGYPERSYFKIPPHFRYVVTDGTTVRAQLGVELRVIRVGDQILRTFGVVDLCVREDSRGQGLASRLLDEVTGYAAACGMDFVILFADDDSLYGRHGFTRVDNPLSWVKINDHRVIGLAQAVTPHELMVRPVSGAAWPAGEIDLLGHVF